ncbi:hypothetical protein ACFZCT_20775 [Streptomyces qaidamensis]|uniref:hypothetical protein n=1 Tax=Streptomyces qaidamensis TaxID=1783515 RepID=UPI0036E0DE1E
MDADPDVMRYIGDGSPGTRGRTAAALARMRAAWDERGFGLFAAEETATGELGAGQGRPFRPSSPRSCRRWRSDGGCGAGPEAGATPRKPHARSWRSPSVRRKRSPAWSASSASAVDHHARTTSPRRPCPWGAGPGHGTHAGGVPLLRVTAA